MADKTTGARALVDALLREGVDHVFGFRARRISRSSTRCATRREIRFILTRHERVPLHGVRLRAYAGRAGGRHGDRRAGRHQLATAIGRRSRATCR